MSGAQQLHLSIDPVAQCAQLLRPDGILDANAAMRPSSLAAWAEGRALTLEQAIAEALNR